MLTCERLPTGVAKVIAAGTLHMRTSFRFFDYKSAYTALPELVGHFQADRHFHLALSLMV